MSLRIRYPPRVPTTMQELDVLYQDNHLLVVNKPAGIATMGAESGETVHSLAVDYLIRKYNKPGRAFVGIVSRLDAMTSGVLVLARTSKAASRLSAQFAASANPPPNKVYLATVHGTIAQDEGDWTDYVRKDDRAKRMRVVSASDTDAKQARLRFLTLATRDDRTVVAVKLDTGRKHQIRVQFAERGHAILGDRKYGSTTPFANGVALHSWRLQITHPTLKQRMWFHADLPKSWQQSGRMLGNMATVRRRVDEHFDLSTDEPT